MSRRIDSTEAIVRRAFDLLLKLRALPQGPRLLPCAVAFLEMLLRQSESEPPPLVVSVRAVPLRGR
jgi:hypothetical protein